MKQHLDDYFERSVTVVKGSDIDRQRLYLLCIQCFEVSWFATFMNVYVMCFDYVEFL